jgi:putative FmdB family regulatory protein
MPTYEYVCKSCGHLFEIVQSMRDEPLRECPECGGELRKVFAPPAISFKGSGFYATDHGKKSSKQPGEKGEKGEKGDKAGKAGTGTEKGDASAAKEGSTSAVGSGSSGPSPGASGSSGSSKEGSSS